MKNLYEKLAPNIQTELKMRIAQEITNLNYVTESNCKKDFYDYLNDISDTFVFGRYIHEKKYANRIPWQ